MRRMGVCALLGLCLAEVAAAHRLDEYLQATLIGVTREGVELEIQLTPGVAMLPGWMAVVDRNRDGRISPDEERAYVERVVGELELRVDGVAAQLSLIESRFPTLEAMREGLGAIGIRLRTSRIGHRLRFENRHLPQVSVYLVNCLAVPSEGLEVRRQTRDETQRSIEFEYSFGADSMLGSLWSFWPAAIGMVLAARMAVLFYRARHLKTSMLTGRN